MYDIHHHFRFTLSFTISVIFLLKQLFVKEISYVAKLLNHNHYRESICIQTIVFRYKNLSQYIHITVIEH